jgi:hypothetical protein
MRRSSGDDDFEDVNSETSDNVDSKPNTKNMSIRELIDTFFPGILELAVDDTTIKSDAADQDSVPPLFNDQILVGLKSEWDQSETKKKFNETLSHLAINRKID